MTQTARKGIATVSAVILWLVLHAVAAVPFIVEPHGAVIVLGGGLLFLEPLF